MCFKVSSAICFNLDQSIILSSGNGLTLNHTTLILNLLKKPSENIVENIENAGNSIYPFPTMFSTV